jgi:hypothetical protein
MSQLDLACEAGISTRHLSFVELGGHCRAATPPRRVIESTAGVGKPVARDPGRCFTPLGKWSTRQMLLSP